MNQRVRHVGRVVVATLLALFTMLPTVGATPLAAENKPVGMKDFKFDPKTMTVAVGDTVTWTNSDQAPHTAQADDGSFDSGDVATGQTFSFTFAKAGTFAYFCKYHGGPNGAGMAGTIVVQDAAAPAATTQPAQSAAPTGSIDVTDQSVANDSITVAKATISQDGWIAVHKAGPDGKLLLTPLVGVAMIKAGDNTNVVIKLTEPVAVGAPLWPMLHIDAGALGTYEFPNGPDVPVTANGMPVMKQIMISGSAAAPAAPAQGSTPTGSIEVANQSVKNNSITVAKATISQDGWIALHKAGPDGKLLLTPLVGVAMIKAGDNTNVVIKLTEPVAVGAPLWPMLHIDAGTLGTYEFPNGPDVPITANGMPVMKQIMITSGAAAPSQLPRTGGSDFPISIVVVALALLLGGVLLRQRVWIRRQ